MTHTYKFTPYVPLQLLKHLAQMRHQQKSLLHEANEMSSIKIDFILVDTIDTLKTLQYVLDHMYKILLVHCMNACTIRMNVAEL